MASSILRPISIACLLASLIACGGGGDDGKGIAVTNRGGSTFPYTAVLSQQTYTNSTSQAVDVKYQTIGDAQLIGDGTGFVEYTYSIIGIRGASVHTNLDGPSTVDASKTIMISLPAGATILTTTGLVLQTANGTATITSIGIASTLAESAM
jgi:hypothetical protein